MKINDFVGFKRYPGTTGQLSTSRIDCRYQNHHPDWLNQSKTHPKYQLFAPTKSITWYQQLQQHDPLGTAKCLAQICPVPRRLDLGSKLYSPRAPASHYIVRMAQGTNALEANGSAPLKGLCYCSCWYQVIDLDGAKSWYFGVDFDWYSQSGCWFW